MKPLLSIQYLRAFAALAVVSFHACQWADIDFDIGAGGVDLFFVISGFLMWGVSQAPGVTAGGFLWRRVVRVTPLYWLATLSLAGLAIGAPGLLPQVKPEARHLALSLLFIPHLDPAGLPFPLLPPGWTLNYEAILYGVFALALTGPRRHRLAVVLASLVALTALGLLVRPLFPLFANPMMLEFAAGVVLGRVHGAGWRASPGLGASLIVMGLITFAALKLLGLHSDIGRWLIWGAPALMIVAGAIGIEAAGALPVSAALKRAGDASYSIYLCHWPAMALFARMLDVTRPWLFIPLAVAGSLVLGLLVHAGIERPLIRRLRPGAASAGVIAL